MHPPFFIRPLSQAERAQLRAGLHSVDAFTLRRCQNLLASDLVQDAALIARNLGWTKGIVLNALGAFHAEGLACLKAKSWRPHSARPLLTEQHLPALEGLLHHGPRLSGTPTSLWTLDLVAEICCARVWTPCMLPEHAAVGRQFRWRFLRVRDPRKELSVCPSDRGASISTSGLTLTTGTLS
jgi:hypothetical protein